MCTRLTFAARDLILGFSPDPSRAGELANPWQFCQLTPLCLPRQATEFGRDRVLELAHQILKNFLGSVAKIAILIDRLKTGLSVVLSSHRWDGHRQRQGSVQGRIAMDLDGFRQVEPTYMEVPKILGLLSL